MNGAGLLVRDPICFERCKVRYGNRNRSGVSAGPKHCPGRRSKWCRAEYTSGIRLLQSSPSVSAEPGSARVSQLI